jgi:hypothetical protein
VSFDIMNTEKGPTAANVAQEDGNLFKRERFDAGQQQQQGGYQRSRGPRRDYSENRGPRRDYSEDREERH